MGDVLAAVAVASVGWIGGMLIKYGATKVELAELKIRVGKLEESQRSDFIPREEFELAHNDLRDRLKRIESKLDRMGGKTE